MLLAGRKGFMVTPLEKGMEYAENRLKRGRYANSFKSRKWAVTAPG
jgi:hypothetical protein